MPKKGKRASGGEGGSDIARRRSIPEEPLRRCRVSGPLVIPPTTQASSKGRGQTTKSHVNLDLESIRVYQEIIFSISDLLVKKECRAWMAFGEEHGFSLSFHRATSEMAHRDNGRITLHNPSVAAALWARVGPFVPAVMDGRTATGCNANIRLYRYTVGQRFGKHIDESVEDENGHISKWTVLVYLNGGEGTGEEGAGAGDGNDGRAGTVLQGGETVFYKGNYGTKVAASFSPVQGACLVHGHGTQCLLHEGARVERGVKYLLRTDVMYA
ncbi:unnamed protein product [Choristocarpus tenellus]